MTKLRPALPYIFLFFLTVFVLDLANPFFEAPARDGGFFLYAGSQILQGKIPYQDFWDSKGPGIFYINALGLLLGGGSRWGVWLVEFLFLFGTFLILFRVISQRWGAGAGLFGTLLAGLGLRVVLGYGNYTEEYALLFNAAGLVLFLSMVDAKPNYLKYLWVGAFFGLSFTFRANNIGGLFAIALSVVAYFGFKRNTAEILRIIISLIVGFSLPLVLWTIYFATLGIAGEMVNASILFNFSYAAAKEREWLDIFGGLGRYGMDWYGWLTLIAWLALCLRFLISLSTRRVSVFETFLLFWFPVEIILSNLSGRNFTHYYISWALAVAIYSAYLFAEFWQVALRVHPLEGLSENASAVMAIAFSLGLFVVFPAALGRYLDSFGNGEYIDPVSAYIHDNSQPGEQLLTWYPEMGINFISGRASPVKYVYYPLFLEGSLTKEIEDRYLEDLMKTPPQLILDCSRSVDAIPSLDEATREEQYAIPGVKKKMYIHPGMDEVFEFVQANYQLENTIDQCLIFRLNQN